MKKNAETRLGDESKKKTTTQTNRGSKDAGAELNQKWKKNTETRPGYKRKKEIKTHTNQGNKDTGAELSWGRKKNAETEPGDKRKKETKTQTYRGNKDAGAEMSRGMKKNYRNEAVLREAKKEEETQLNRGCKIARTGKEEYDNMSGSKRRIHCGKEPDTSSKEGRKVLELCTLGTGGTLPLADRALSSLYVRENGRAMLIDCGEGTQVGIRKLGWGFRCIEDVLLTHYHGDHCTGLAGLLLSLEKAGKTETLHLWGPKGLKRVVEGLCVIVPPLSYPVLLHELPPEGGGLEAIGLQIRAFPVDHGGIPCYGYRMTLPRKNAFSPEKASALGIPVTEWKKLQDGESVRVSGRKIRPEEVTGSPRKGITVVFSTDTRPCETLRKYTKEADLLILEGMYADEEKLPQALKNHHMMFREAAEIAREASPAALLLTHFSTSLEDPESGLDSARNVFEKTWTAKDGQTVTLRYPVKEEKAWISLC